MKHLLPILLLLAAPALADQVFVLMDGGTVLVEEDLHYPGLFVGAEYDSLTIRLEGAATYGTVMRDGEEVPGEIFVLMETLHDEATSMTYRPPEGAFVFESVLHPGISEIPDPFTFRVWFMYFLGQDEIITPSRVDGLTMTLTAHTTEVASGGATFGRLKTLYR